MTSLLILTALLIAAAFAQDTPPPFTKPSTITPYDCKRISCFGDVCRLGCRDTKCGEQGQCVRDEEHPGAYVCVCSGVWPPAPTTIATTTTTET